LRFFGYNFGIEKNIISIMNDFIEKYNQYHQQFCSVPTNFIQDQNWNLWAWITNFQFWTECLVSE